MRPLLTSTALTHRSFTWLSAYNIEYAALFDGSTGYLTWTPSSAGDRDNFTLSYWASADTLGVVLGVSQDGSNYTAIDWNNSNEFSFEQVVAGASNGRRGSNAVYRDYAKLYHVVVTYESSTSSMKGYVNGTEITSWRINNALTANQDSFINATLAHDIGRFPTGINYFNGYLAEIHFIDGQVLDASSFGETDTNGNWVAKRYTGSYGTNGFYLDFSNGGSLGTDASGNGNNWTVNGTVTQVTSTPTDTACTWNPLEVVAPGITYSNGNLTVTSSGNQTTGATIGVASGKWSFEVVWDTAPLSSNGSIVGIDTQPITGGSELRAYAADGTYYDGSSYVAYGATFTTGDIIRCEFDMDLDTVEFFKNGVSQGKKTSAGITSSIKAPLIKPRADATGAAVTGRFEEADWTGTPTAGFKALSTANLPAPAIANPQDHFEVYAFTHTNGVDSPIPLNWDVTSEGGLLWHKKRDAAGTYHFLWDNVRNDYNAYLNADATTAETSLAGFIVDTTTGFDFKSGWASGDYVAWCWKANGAGVSNTDGSITATVSANTTAGFSIVTFTGSGANATVGHGLSQAPELIIAKNLTDGTQSWAVGETAANSFANWMKLNTTDASGASATIWNSTDPTSTVFSVGSATNTNGNTNSIVAYCWHSVEGYSKIGSYTGNGSTDGPFVYCGFRPRWIVIKNADAAANWNIFDTERNEYNLTNLELSANDAGAEATYTNAIDVLSNGFKIIGNPSELNTANTHIFMAFADQPLKTSNAR